MSTVAPEPTPSSRESSTGTPPSIAKLFDDLRRRIRRYVVLEGVAMSIVWLISAFWIMLAIDYLPVLLGANEMPRQARMVLLSIAGCGMLVVLYWYILRRVFHAFRDSSLAILIERQFPEFRDSLVTTVQLREGWSDLESEDQAAIERALASPQPSSTPPAEFAAGQGHRMLRATVERATRDAPSVDLSKVFNYMPLVSKWCGAIIALASIVMLGVWGGDVLGVGASRLLALSDNPWPRRARIEMVGFEGGERKLAKGTDLTIRVRAEADREYPPPDLCSILYATVDGDSGRVNMSRDGEPRDGYQYYVFTGKPFKGVLNDIRFDVIGYDHRLRDQLVKVVLSPVVVKVALESELPAYLGQEPRTEDWSPGYQLPIGTQVSATVHSSKPLVGATIRDVDTGEETQFDFQSTGQNEWRMELGSMSGRKSVAITLRDTDKIESLEPHFLTIGAVDDAVPEVDLALRGIGSAVTAQARLPMEGTIRDDYELARTWFQLKRGEETREFDFQVVDEDGNVEVNLDLRAESASEKPQPLQLEMQDRLVLSVKATDKYDLDGGSHTGSSEATTLTVVRSDELLAILDGRELGLRRRLEQIRSEMLQSRDSLARLRSSFKDSAGGSAGTERPEEPVEGQGDGAQSEQEAEENLLGLRDRWASWAMQKGDQSSSEIEGIALAFEDIREELINNRVDTQERKSRLESEIIAPLRVIANTMFPAWQTSLGELRTLVAQRSVDAEANAVEVVGEADQILVAMDAILDKMLELEDYTELVNIVRQIIEQQESLLEKTKEEQKSRVLDFLDD